MKKYRWFGGFLNAQEKWLNKMAAQGYRLTRAGKLAYEFEECAPDAVRYRVEFIGEKSRANAEDYRAFLEEMGYKVFYKNVNLSFSVGKVRYRPWAEKGGRVATKATTYNRELLIVEKKNDGSPFELHTSLEDLADYYRRLCAPWASFLAVFGAFGITMRSPVFGAFALAALVPVVFYGTRIFRLKKEMKFKE